MDCHGQHLIHHKVPWASVRRSPTASFRCYMLELRQIVCRSYWQYSSTSYRTTWTRLLTHSVSSQLLLRCRRWHHASDRVNALRDCVYVPSSWNNSIVTRETACKQECLLRATHQAFTRRQTQFVVRSAARPYRWHCRHRSLHYYWLAAIFLGLLPL